MEGLPIFKQFFNLFIVGISTNATIYVLLLFLTVPMYTILSKYQNIPYRVAIVGCIYIGSATTSFRGLGNIAQEKTTADIDQLWPRSEIA